MMEQVEIGPHPFWRWAIHPGSPGVGPGIGFMRRAEAERVRDEIAAELPYLPRSYLLRRKGLRSFEIIDGGEAPTERLPAVQADE